MPEEYALTDDELAKIAYNLERGIYGPWEIRRLIMACRTQRRVLRHLFQLFVDDEFNMRATADSIRTSNLAALKREVGLEEGADE